MTNSLFFLAVAVGLVGTFVILRPRWRGDKKQVGALIVVAIIVLSYVGVTTYETYQRKAYLRDYCPAGQYAVSAEWNGWVCVEGEKIP